MFRRYRLPAMTVPRIICRRVAATSVTDWLTAAGEVSHSDLFATRTHSKTQPNYANHTHRNATSPTGIELTGDATSATEAEMEEEAAAREAFIDRVSPSLAPLPSRPSRRAGNVNRVEFLGTAIVAR